MDGCNYNVLGLSPILIHMIYISDKVTINNLEYVAFNASTLQV